MTPTDISERGFETTIVNWLVDENGYEQGAAADFDRASAIDTAKLSAFLSATQPEIAETLKLSENGIESKKFFHRLCDEIGQRGVADVLQKGVQHYPIQESINVFYGAPTPDNDEAAKLFSANIFSVTRQVKYSSAETGRALDLVLFVNGLPVATLELKNNLTKQTAADAVRQYKKDRNPREMLFALGRCVVHFALDEREVQMCTHLCGKDSWFLPFNQGFNNGAGNPPNPQGFATDYLWKKIFSKESLADILEHYTQMAGTEAGNKQQIFPRYHQLEAVWQLLADAAQKGAGQRYLIQHSAGSGKSNSIAWLASQLVGLKKQNSAVFDSVVVITDRTILDQQIFRTMRHMVPIGSMVAHPARAGELGEFIREGKKIIITTLQKFPFVLNDIASSQRSKKFAIIIDEAHSSQGGRATGHVDTVLGQGGDEEETFEDKIHNIIKEHRMLTNASYFAFTATPKNKTLELFGTKKNGKFYPFHSYTMKQAIAEGFILDPLKNYTPVDRYFHVIKAVEDDPVFDAKKAAKKMRRYAETSDIAINQKTKIMVDHFISQVLRHKKIGGKARAMVVTSGVKLAIDYFHAFRRCLPDNNQIRPIVAFSGEREDGGQQVSEASLNGFPSDQIAKKIREEPYRFLIVADKFQTGYDEPLLHTMYVDKALSGVRTVQTLSRLNRACAGKHDTFVLDFCNSSDSVAEAFGPYYRTTILSGETDPNKLHDVKRKLDNYKIYEDGQVENVVWSFLEKQPRETFEPILDSCVAAYNELDEDGQVDFKSSAKTFVRAYMFLSLILPDIYQAWEKLRIFLDLLTPKLPAPKEDDFSQGILDAVDLENYRAEAQAKMNISLSDEEEEIDPMPIGGDSVNPEPELDALSVIIAEFNAEYGELGWDDIDKTRQTIREYIPTKLKENRPYQNAIKNSDKQNAKEAYNAALRHIMAGLFDENMELYRRYTDDSSFQKWLSEKMFAATYQHGK
ncbi:MAG: type I restriction endonuclease subunit R [Gammaproteobacteria bacterium]